MDRTQEDTLKGLESATYTRYKLGDFYKDGEGMGPEPQQALVWYFVGTDNGSSSANDQKEVR